MNRDKKIIYILSSLLFAVLSIVLFVTAGNSRIITACVLLPLTVATCLMIKKRRTFSIVKKEVLLLVSIVAIIFVALKEMTGIYFEFYKNPYFVNREITFRFILPIIAIIVMTEIVRSVLLAQKSKFASVISFLTCVLAEMLSFSSISGITTFNRFMDFVGMTFFPAISANIYYHYISKRYGALPNIIFRLLTTIYIYFIPMTTGMSDSIASCIKIILPIVMLALTASLFDKKKKNAVRKGRKLGLISTALTVAIIVSVAMLVSCQFRFGALVIATESMTGEINKGDVIVYERYDGQAVKEGQVIVFLQDGARIVHRVVAVENISGEVRYYTKGDANEDLDRGYRVASDIVGTTDMKLAFIGYPTLWIREIIKN